MAMAYVDRGSAFTVQLLNHVRFAATTADRLGPEDHLLVHVDLGIWNKEPLALANEHVRSTPQSLLSLAPLPLLKAPHNIRLQCLFSGHHGADRGLLRHSRNKPVSLVVPAQELILGIRKAAAIRTLTHYQQQMAILGLHIENVDLGCGIGLDIEILPVPVVASSLYGARQGLLMPPDSIFP